ncbi:hypothetical protein AB8E26_05455 [Stenotrophomonas rhizophila]|uniref:hypothetical protein n=1 Tax=Stenotrophomonas rhizophila TaxID=216778 RepID=UPI003516950C
MADRLRGRGGHDAAAGASVLLQRGMRCLFRRNRTVAEIILADVSISGTPLRCIP